VLLDTATGMGDVATVFDQTAETHDELLEASSPRRVGESVTTPPSTVNLPR
jgi:hypothetical protein